MVFPLCAYNLFWGGSWRIKAHFHDRLLTLIISWKTPCLQMLSHSEILVVRISTSGFWGMQLRISYPSAWRVLIPSSICKFQAHSLNECPVSMKFSLTLCTVAQLPYVPGGPSTSSPHMKLLAWRLDFCFYLLGTQGLYNSWGLAVPTVNGPFWLSSAPNILCMATCIIHERTRVTQGLLLICKNYWLWQNSLLCSPLCHICGNYCSFSNCLSMMAPCSCHRGDIPILLGRGKRGQCHDHCGLCGMAYPGASFPPFSIFPCFPTLWFLSHAPRQKWIEWIVSC